MIIYDLNLFFFITSIVATLIHKGLVSILKYIFFKKKIYLSICGFNYAISYLKIKKYKNIKKYNK